MNVGTLAIILNILGCSLEKFFKKVDTRMKEDIQSLVN
ncbi:hypothetical protein RI835_004085 [Providencia rettgeri]|nr:hypothetical protein [Providencia rettgeri]HEM7134170.1 hypothetical protein [Providencia rettgeri]